MAKTKVQEPGAVLLSFIEEYDLNPSRLGVAVKLSQSTIRQITLNKMKISVPVALRLAKFFGNSVEFWTDIQMKYELEMAAKDTELSAVLKEIQKIKKPAPVKAKTEAFKKPSAKEPKPAAKKTAAKKASAKKPALSGRKRTAAKKA